MRQIDARKLLDWYERQKRDLPWRRSNDPYAVLVSEIMLQQTTVAAVVPKYESWMEVFPTPAALAAASSEEVMAQWSGLGYYQRARRLHQCIKEVCELGGFPTTLEGLLNLPGLGPYTAAAVASICFERPALAVDTNVVRVLYRYYALSYEPGHREADSLLRDRTRSVLEWAHPGELNQALMELGASLCSVREPGCLLCPMGAGCEGRRAESGPTAFPLKKAKKKAVVTPGKVLLLEREDSKAVLLIRGTSLGLLSELYQPPMIFSLDLDPPSPLAVVGEKIARRSPRETSSFQYGISGRKLALEVSLWQMTESECEHCRQVLREAGLNPRWYERTDSVENPPISSLTRKALKIWRESL